MYHVYILRSITSGRFYIGQTHDLDARLARHNAGGCVATRGKGPWELLHARRFETRTEAMAEERRLKGMKSRDYLLRMIDRG